MKRTWKIRGISVKFTWNCAGVQANSRKWQNAEGSALNFCLCCQREEQRDDVGRQLCCVRQRMKQAVSLADKRRLFMERCVALYAIAMRITA
jgi:hypothetical protein